MSEPNTGRVMSVPIPAPVPSPFPMKTNSSFSTEGYNCQLCGAIHTSAKELKDHLQSVHPKNGEGRTSNEELTLSM